MRICTNRQRRNWLAGHCFELEFKKGFKSLSISTFVPYEHPIYTTYFTDVLIRQQLPVTLCALLCVQSDLHLFSFLKVHIVQLHYS